MKAERSMIIGGVLYRRGQELPEATPQVKAEPTPEPDLEVTELPKLKGKKL